MGRHARSEAFGPSFVESLAARCRRMPHVDRDDAQQLRPVRIVVRKIAVGAGLGIALGLLAWVLPRRRHEACEGDPWEYLGFGLLGGLLFELTVGFRNWGAIKDAWRSSRGPRS